MWEMKKEKEKTNSHTDFSLRWTADDTVNGNIQCESDSWYLAFFRSRLFLIVIAYFCAKEHTTVGILSPAAEAGSKFQTFTVV